MNIAVIGAGVSGIACAKELVALNHRVTVFDKSRGVGGRATSKRWIDGIAIDMGIPYMVNPSNSVIQSYVNNGVLVPWRMRTSTGTRDAYVGTPKMSAWVREMSDGIPLISQQRIQSISYASTWTIVSETMASWGGFDALIFAIPAPQLCDIHGLPHDLRNHASRVTYNAVNTLLLELSAPVGAVDFMTFDDGYLDYCIADYKKPGRDTHRFTYALHATQDWSTRTIDSLHPDQVQSMMMAQFNRQVTHVPQVIHSVLHRWRYAQVDTGYPYGCMGKSSLEAPIHVIGDWCNGGDFMGAFDSGQKMAHTIGQ